MPQISDQPHSRTRSRRHTRNDAMSSLKNHQGFVKKTIEFAVMAFVILTVVLFLALTFDRNAPAMAAAAGSDDHHFAGKGKRFTLDIPVSPPPNMQLRGSLKRASRDSRSGSGESDIKDRLNSLEGNEVDIDIIAQQATDAASKASQAAVEAGIVAVAAVVEATTSSAGAASEGGPWDFPVTME